MLGQVLEHAAEWSASNMDFLLLSTGRRFGFGRRQAADRWQRGVCTARKRTTCALNSASSSSTMSTAPHARQSMCRPPLSAQMTTSSTTCCLVWDGTSGRCCSRPLPTPSVCPPRTLRSPRGICATEGEMSDRPGQGRGSGVAASRCHAADPRPVDSPSCGAGAWGVPGARRESARRGR